MGKRIVLIVIAVAAALALTGNSIGWIQRTELTREEYFASFAQNYREQGKDDDGNTTIVVSAPDFSRLQRETNRPIAEMNVNDLQVLVSEHPALQRDYAFTVDEVSQEAVQKGFFEELALGYLYQAAETAQIDGRWSDRKTEQDEALLGEAIEVSAGSSQEPADAGLEEYLRWYRDGKAENLLVMPGNYNYWKVGDALEPEQAEATGYQPIRELTGISFEVDAADYYEILLEELVLMDLDESKTEYASELTFDNLQAYVNAEFEKEIMRKALVNRLAERSDGMGALQDELNTVTTTIKNETDSGYEWAESLAVFEVMAENYADYDNLLMTISQNSQGDLKEQADALRAAAKTAMRIRLETYRGFQNATRSDYDVRWLNAIFFDAAKASEEYRSDPAFAGMIDEAQRLFGLVSIRQDMKQNIAAMTELPQADLESCLHSASELAAQGEIDQILERAVYTLIGQIGKEQSAGTLRRASGETYIACSKYLLFGRMHGEYLLRGFVSTGDDTREWFRESTGTDVVSWYDAKSSNLLNMRSDLLKVHESELETYEGHTYLCVDSAKTWDEAKTFCESMGGHLVTVTSEGEQKFLESIVKNGDKHQYWLGGKAAEDGYAWITGEEFSYTNWDKDEPGGSGLTAGGSCLQILRTPDPKVEDSRAFGWRVAPADNTYQVEKPELLKQQEEAQKAEQEALAGLTEEDKADAAKKAAEEEEKMTPEQKAAAQKEQEALKEAQDKYKADLEVTGFYGKDNIGFICEWD